MSEIIFQKKQDSYRQSIKQKEIQKDLKNKEQELAERQMQLRQQRLKRQEQNRKEDLQRSKARSKFELAHRQLNTHNEEQQLKRLQSEWQAQKKTSDSSKAKHEPLFKGSSLREAVSASPRRTSKISHLRQPEKFAWQPLKIFIACTEPAFNHVGLYCSECNTKSFSGIRLSCLVCDKVELCARCFEERKHPVQHPFAIIQNQLNRMGENKLDFLKQNYKVSEEAQEGLSWQSFCDECEEFKESVFFTGIVEGFTLCKRCFKGHLSLIKEHHVVQLLHVAPRLQLEEFDRDGKKYGLEGRLARLKHRASGREFMLSTVQVKVLNQEHYLRSRNQLLKFRGNHIENVYGYQEEEVAGRLTLYFLEEWMANLTLTELIASSAFKSHSFRRRMGIFRSLTAALKMIHSLNLFHGNLSPESILLDKYHEVRLELLPFVNHEAVLEGLELRDNAFAEKGSVARGPPADIYSLGLIMNLVLTGQSHEGGIKPRFKKCVLFKEVINKCIMDVAGRPTAAELDAYFTKFEATFWSVVGKKVGRKEYEGLSTAEKDHLFQQIYQQFE